MAARRQGTTKEDRLRLGQAQAALAAALDTGRASRIDEAREELVRVLREVFPEVRDAAGDDADAAARTMEQLDVLLRVWTPVGFTPEDVQAVLGEPSRRSRTRLVYHLDSGYASVTWRFAIDGGRVSGIQLVLGE